MEDLNTEIARIIEETKAEDTMWNKMCDYEEGKEALGGSVPPYLPEGEQFRVVKLLEDDKGCPCGGTHVKHISDIGGVTVKRIQKKKKNTRVSYSVN